MCGPTSPAGTRTSSISTLSNPAPSIVRPVSRSGWHPSASAAPQQYRPVTGNCGVVLIWTKVG